MQDLGSLGGTGFAFNNSNPIAGRSLLTNNARLRAFIYNPGAGMMNIGTLGGDSIAFGINNFGVVTGTTGGMVFVCSSGILPVLPLGF